MRKTLLLAVSAALLTLASCNKEEVVETNEKESPVFTASIAGSTRTTIDVADGKVAWEATDEITVTDASSASAVYKIKSIDTETGKATFVIKDGETVLGDGPYSATYGTAPATTQNYSATAGKLYMTAPETEDNSFTFTVQCGLMKLSLTQARVNVKSIAVTGTPTGGSETTYTLNCTDAQSIASAKDFYIALPAGGYNKIVITASWGWTCTKTVKSAPLSVVANHIKPVTFTSLSFDPEHELSSLYLFTEDVDEAHRLDYLQDIWGIQWTPSENEDPENPGRLSAYEDPENPGRFYSTFYDSQNAYIIPAGVKAYTGKMDRDNDQVTLTAINGDILPAGVAVLLYSAYDEIELIKTDSSAEFIGDNDFRGVDVISDPVEELFGEFIMLSYGQSCLGFYKMTCDMRLSAHRAFLVFENAP